MKKTTYLPISAILIIVISRIFLGSAFPMIKIGYELFGVTHTSSKILFAGIRFFIAGILVLSVTSVKQRRFPTIRRANTTNILLVAATYTFLQYLFFYIGLSNTSGASASIVSPTSVFMAAIISHFVYPNDKLTPGKSIGTVIGFLGVLLAALANDSLGRFSFFGEGFIACSSFFFVIGSMLNKRATRLDDSFSVSSYNLLIGGAMLIISGLLGGAESLTITPKGMLVLIYLSLLSAFSFTIWSSMARLYSIAKITVYNFIIPLSGSFLSAILLGDNIFRWQYILALFLICAGIIAVNRVPNE